MEQGERLSARKVMLYTAAVLVTLLGFFVLYQIYNLIVLLLFCIIVAQAIEPVVNWLRRGPFNRAAGILVVYSFIFAIIAAILVLTVPVLVNQVAGLVQNLPQLQRQAVDYLNQNNFGGFGTQIAQFIEKFDFGQVIGAVGGEATGAVFGAASLIFNTILAFVITFYWLTERTAIKRGIVALFAPDTGQRVRRIWDDVELSVSAWVRGQLVLMGTIAVAALIFYSILGLPYVPVLAIIAGLFELIPVIGPWLAAVPTLLIAATLGTDKLIIVLIYSVIIQLFEANILVPRVMHNAVELSPLTIIVALLAGDAIYGIVGALLAVPIAGAISVIVSDLRENRADTAATATATISTDNKERDSNARLSPTSQPIITAPMTTAEIEQAGLAPLLPPATSTDTTQSALAAFANQVTTPDQSVLLIAALGPQTQVGPNVQTTLGAGNSVGKVRTSGPALTTVATATTPEGPRTVVTTQTSEGHAVLATEPGEENRQ